MLEISVDKRYLEHEQYCKPGREVKHHIRYSYDVQVENVDQPSLLKSSQVTHQFSPERAIDKGFLRHCGIPVMYLEPDTK